MNATKCSEKLSLPLAAFVMLQTLYLLRSITSEWPSSIPKTPESESLRLSDIMQRAIDKAAFKEYNSSTGGDAKQIVTPNILII